MIRMMRSRPSMGCSRLGCILRDRVRNRPICRLCVRRILAANVALLSLGGGRAGRWWTGWRWRWWQRRRSRRAQLLLGATDRREAVVACCSNRRRQRCYQSQGHGDVVLNHSGSCSAVGADQRRRHAAEARQTRTYSTQSPPTQTTRTAPSSLHNSLRRFNEWKWMGGMEIGRC